MLLFITAEPKQGTEAHGVIQRVQMIDAQFADCHRKLIFISMRRNLRARVEVINEKLTVEHLNSWLHGAQLLKYGLNSKLIYMHTCLAAVRAFMLCCFSRKLVLDIHGLLPEEFLMMRKKRPGSPLHRLCEWIERFSISRSAAVVVVTNAMRDHLNRKYPRSKAASFTIPIFAEVGGVEVSGERESNLVVYSGGLQEWQCIGQMLDIAERVGDHMSFLFLSGEAETLKAMVAGRRIPTAAITSATQKELPAIYKRCTYGFVLRASSIINNVACPTKLVEYLEYGIIPIVREKELGDFSAVGYQYITDEDFATGSLPTKTTLLEMRETNKRAIQELKRRSEDGVSKLRRCFGVMKSEGRS